MGEMATTYHSNIVKIFFPIYVVRKIQLLTQMCLGMGMRSIGTKIIVNG